MYEVSHRVPTCNGTGSLTFECVLQLTVLLSPTNHNVYSFQKLLELKLRNGCPYTAETSLDLPKVSQAPPFTCGSASSSWLRYWFRSLHRLRELLSKREPCHRQKSQVIVQTYRCGLWLVVALCFLYLHVLDGCQQHTVLVEKSAFKHVSCSAECAGSRQPSS